MLKEELTHHNEVSRCTHMHVIRLRVQPRQVQQAAYAHMVMEFAIRVSLN